NRLRIPSSIHESSIITKNKQSARCNKRRKDGSKIFLLAADHLLLVVLAGEGLERGLDDAPAEAEHEVQRRLLLDVVVGQRAPVLQLLPREDQPLLVRRDPLLVLDLGLDIVDGVAALDLERDGLARQGLDEDLH
uniref:Uncharacterized protein n=1 Tax=Aegilops tauschii subsp. strangulata TaxID=200361 RepID=A0A453H003_AEGTS